MHSIFQYDIHCATKLSIITTRPRSASTIAVSNQADQHFSPVIGTLAPDSSLTGHGMCHHNRNPNKNANGRLFEYASINYFIINPCMHT